MSTKRDLRIVFMGTPDFAVATLDRLVTEGYTIVGVITAPDRPSGRGQKLRQSAVKTYALSKGLKVLQPTNLKAESFIEELQELNANLQIVVAFRMLPKVVWAMPEYGTFNLHASLLPDYRGAAPIHWAIINGETKTGVTTFFIDEKIDTGAIIMRASTSIGADETVGELHDRLMTLGSDVVIDTVKHIEYNTVETSIQPKIENLKTAHKLHRDSCKIDWDQPVDVVYNKIRGLNPFPAAWCYLVDGDDFEAIKIYAVKKQPSTHQSSPGSMIITNDQIKVACTDGYIIILEMQLPGKRRMDVKSLLNGYEFSPEAKLR
ncbi:MAG: methionyl-tRNA formyltransferase [Winogradskyella sp.]|nr:methionyl-tRNA formyltransferase [Winogradskyella sp.]MBT8377200.1 methionyl-tRNA formyltransferase [Bacteroidia bacterium]NNC46614.1 methionyl-tRNA formyltransferase [Winogradskyella sp.]